MTKRNKIIYWVATLWLSLGMTSAGIMQMLGKADEVALFSKLGYPTYLLQLLGITKLLAVIALLIPRYPLVKEWAYAGCFFTMAGALYSHIAMGNGAADIFPPVLLLVLTAISWYFRPAERKIATLKQ